MRFRDISKLPGETGEEYAARFKAHIASLGIRRPDAKDPASSGPAEPADAKDPASSGPLTQKTLRQADPGTLPDAKDPASSGPLTQKTLRQRRGSARANVGAAAQASHLARRAKLVDSDAAMHPKIPAGPAARAIRQLAAELGLGYGETIAKVFEDNEEQKENVK